MGIFSFIDDLLDSTEEVITETPKTVKEKAPELAAFVGKTALNAGQKAVTFAGKKLAHFQSEAFNQKLRDPSIDIEQRRHALARYIEGKNKAIDASIHMLNMKLENPNLSASERASIEQELRGLERERQKVAHEERHLQAEIERYS